MIVHYDLAVAWFPLTWSLAMLLVSMVLLVICPFHDDRAKMGRRPTRRIP